MNIFIDGDSCPREIRAIVMRAGEKRSIPAVFVANKKLSDVHSPAKNVVVSLDNEAADTYIIENVGENDLVVTRDIPLAEKLTAKGITVINDRGDVFEADTVRERLSIRDYMKNLREIGLAPPLGKRKYGEGEKKRFADTFNRELTRLQKKVKTIP